MKPVTVVGIVESKIILKIFVYTVFNYYLCNQIILKEYSVMKKIVKPETKNKTTKGRTKEDVKKVVIDGIEYLTLPDSEIFTDMDKKVIQQRINRKTLKVEKLGKYVFVPYTSCLEIRDEHETNLKKKVLEDLVMKDLSIEEIKKMVEESKHNRKVQ